MEVFKPQQAWALPRGGILKKIIASIIPFFSRGAERSAVKTASDAVLSAGKSLLESCLQNRALQHSILECATLLCTSTLSASRQKVSSSSNAAVHDGSVPSNNNILPIAFGQGVWELERRLLGKAKAGAGAKSSLLEMTEEGLSLVLHVLKFSACVRTDTHGGSSRAAVSSTGRRPRNWSKIASFAAPLTPDSQWHTRTVKTQRAADWQIGKRARIRRQFFLRLVTIHWSPLQDFLASTEQHGILASADQAPFQCSPWRS